MDAQLKQKIADWHGQHAAAAYTRWLRTNNESDLRDFARHTAIADRMWAA